jgi:uncharacterized membrane protein
MRAIAVIVAILGLAAFVYGILFIAQAGSLTDVEVGSLQNMSGTVDIILGLAMFLTGVWMLRKSGSA